jgi:hypothetical protein
MKDDIIQRYWVAYLKHWKQDVKDVSNPPTENGFWAWYAIEKLSEQP